MDIKAIKTKPYSDQKTGTSGLRRKVSVYRQEGYLENFIQSIFDSLEGFEGKTLIVGGDGRFYNDKAIQTVIKMAIANQFGRIVIGQNGLMSTPAVSHLIEKRGAFGGIILSASHNPGGPDHDFGVKYNIETGAGAPEAITDKINARTKVIDRYWTVDIPDVDLSTLGEQQIGTITIEVVDPVTDYADYMQEIFDFGLLKKLFKSGFKFLFDGMNAVTGPYAKRIFVDLLGADESSVIRAEPLPDFGGVHPEPNLVYAKSLVELAYSDLAPDFAATSDGDGDRYMILGKKFFLAPSDSLAVISKYIEQIPFYKGKMYGAARTLPTAAAVDAVGKKNGFDVYETPTGWKYFASLLDAKKVTVCGEESFGTGSIHLHEKDGIWAILMWLSIVAKTGKSVPEIMQEHWNMFGRVYCSTHNYEEVDADGANVLMYELKEKLPTLPGQKFGHLTVKEAKMLDYTDPITGETADMEVFRIIFDDNSQLTTRLSGTGSSGATMRVYYSKEVTDKALLNEETQSVLADTIVASVELMEIKKHVGRDAPTVIT